MENSDFINESISLEGIYEQCNENLREQARKRDQLLIFYSAIIAVIIGNIEKLSEIQNIEYIYCLFIIVSWIISSIIINYMKWHSLYNYSAITLQNIMFFKQEKIKQKTVNGLFYKVSRVEGYGIKYYLGKVETKMLNLYLLMSSLNHYICIYFYLSNKENKNIYNFLYIFSTIISIIYIIYYNHKAYNEIKNIVVNDNMKFDKVPVWCINLYQFEQEIHVELQENSFKKK